MKITSVDFGVVKLTRQYVGGALGGIGMGIMVASFLRYEGIAVPTYGWINPLIYIGCLSLIVIGGHLARSEQKRFRVSGL